MGKYVSNIKTDYSLKSVKEVELDILEKEYS